MRTAIPLAQVEESNRFRPSRSQFANERLSVHRPVLFGPKTQNKGSNFPTDDEVVEGILQGKTEVVFQYFQSNRNHILNTLLRYKLRDVDSHIGEVYIHFISRIKKFDKSRGSLRNILYYSVHDAARAICSSTGVIKQSVATYRTHKKTRQALTNLDFDLRCDPEPEVDRELHNSIQRLHGKRKEICLALLKGLSKSEVGVLLGLSKSSISSYVAEIRSLLETYGHAPTRRTDKQPAICNRG